ncbi:MAG: hypothetical protein QM644_16800 [Mobilitalea sp.]
MLNGTTLKISWNTIKGYNRYNVYRSTNYSGPYKLIKETNQTTFTDEGLEKGNAYFYKVKAINSNIVLSSSISYKYMKMEGIPDVLGSSKIKSNKDTVILVSTKNTVTSLANVSFYRKKNGVYQLEFSTIGYVGENGIGKIKEGDEKTPSGTYGFSMAFGISKAPKGMKIPYTQVNSTHWVVSDSYSKYYNKFVSTKDVKKDWKESYGEQLYKYTRSYTYALFIDYNKESVKNKGSAIFLHCYSGKEYTIGCIAIPKDKMKYLMTRLALDSHGNISSQIIINTYDKLLDK